MSNGMPYDSDAGRGTAAAITALMTGRGYAQSAKVAAAIGPYERYEENREAHNDVMRMHRDASYAIPDSTLHGHRAARGRARVVGGGRRRSARSTATATRRRRCSRPTGTISFLMDCDTTGVEPDFSLVKFKELVGGGQMTIVNRTIPMALRTLGYSDEQIEQIEAHVNEHATIVGAPELAAEHLPVFDVAVGERAISHMGHIKMMGAVQPFLSGAISKTVNLPQTATRRGHRRRLHRGLALRRQGAGHLPRRLEDRAGAAHRRPAGRRHRRASPTPWPRRSRACTPRSSSTPRSPRPSPRPRPRSGPARKRMPVERQSITHKFSIGGHEGYITAGVYDDGSVGEIFLTDVGKEGSALRGMMNSFATAISIALQYGVPLETLVQKFSYMRFDPEGITQNPEIPFAKSMPDYIMRWLASRFLDTDTQEELGILTPEVRARKMAEDAATSMASDTAEPVATAARAPPPRARRRRRAARDARRGGGHARRAHRRRLAAGHDPRRRRGPDRQAARRPGPPGRPRPRPGLQPVRRHDAAHGLLLHVLELRQQHRLRLIARRLGPREAGPQPSRRCGASDRSRRCM